MKYQPYDDSVFDYFGLYSWRCPECGRRGDAYGTAEHAMKMLGYHYDSHIFAGYGEMNI